MSAPYRSGPPRGGHIEGLDELESKLRAGVRRRRLVMGFLALAFGLALIVVGTMMALQRGGLRLAIAMVLVGVGLAAFAFVTLRIGEIRDREGLVEVHEVDPIPWSTLGLVSAGILLVTGLVAAYPLGVYRWADTLRSPCRSVFTPKDAAAMGLAAFTMDQVTNDARHCTMTGKSGDRRTVQVTLATDEGSSPYLRGERTPLPGLGADSVLVERAGETILVARRGRGTMLVHLASRDYDREAALRIAKHLETKVALLERYAR